MAAQNKRLVFNFDGTWNRLDAVCPTNVVLTAESILPLDGQGVAQLNYYDQGVGTDKGDRLRGGAFGRGLTRNLADAYRNLVFNYTPGDEIFIFGFSRGAFSARSFAGLIRNSGIVRREHADRTPRAIELYRSRNSGDAPKGQAAAEFRAAFAHPPAEIAYLGVWDTVGALGIPNFLSIARFFNGRHAFHDCSLSSAVRSARHAVAIDETRRTFEPTLWDNFEQLNRERGKDPAADDAPYQQKWFSGVHSAVGGGTPSRGLSDHALEWVWAGARRAGLALDSSPDSRLYSLQPDFTHPLDGTEPAAAAKRRLALSEWRKTPRANGPAKVVHVSISARRRWHAPVERLPGKAPYRPPALRALAEALDADADGVAVALLPEPGTFEIVEVQSGDTLSKIARDRLGDVGRWREILAMNADTLIDPDRIYRGMTLRVPWPTADTAAPPR